MESSPEAFVDFLNLPSETLAGVVALATRGGAGRSLGSHLRLDLALRLPEPLLWEARGLGPSLGTSMPLHRIVAGEATLDLKLDDLRVTRCASPRLPRRHISVSVLVSHGGLSLVQVIEGL